MQFFRFRQGDVLLLPTDKVNGVKLPHLVLATGEVTGHKHQIANGQAELYEAYDGMLVLRVLSETATLTHEEHKPITIPQGIWMVRIQREYQSKSEAEFTAEANVGWGHVED